MNLSEVPCQPVATRLSILTGIDAAVATSMGEIRAVTSAATMATFYVDDLDEAQLAANRRVVAISGSTCIAAALSDHQHFAAAYDKAGLAGFVIATRHAPDDLELDWLMVHPRHHGTGVAAALMQAGLRWLGEDQPVWLTVIRHNERAIRFYRRFGFEIDPTATTSHAVPHWIMRRAGLADAACGPDAQPAA